MRARQRSHHAPRASVGAAVRFAVVGAIFASGCGNGAQSSMGGVNAGGIANAGGATDGGVSSGGGGTGAGGVSGSGGSTGGSTPTGGTTSSGGGVGNDGGLAMGGTSSGGTSSGGAFAADGSTQGSGDSGTQCRTSTVIYLMLDQSLSMLEPGATSSSTKWSTAVDAVSSFVGSANHSGTSVGLGFFPPLSGTSYCDGTGFNVPVVAVGQLPGNASNITSQLTTPTTPAGLGTPTEGALRGATAFCEQYRATHTAEDCVVVFVTDGQPSTCDVNPTDLVQVVTDAHAAGVRLYAAGMLASTAGEVDMVFIDNLANAGGTLTGYTDVALALDDASKAAPSCD